MSYCYTTYEMLTWHVEITYCVTDSRICLNKKKKKKKKKVQILEWCKWCKRVFVASLPTNFSKFFPILLYVYLFLGKKLKQPKIHTLELTKKGSWDEFDNYYLISLQCASVRWKPTICWAVQLLVQISTSTPIKLV